MSDIASQATPQTVLRDRIMNPSTPKTEPEWWAARHITELETQLSAANARADRYKSALENIIGQTDDQFHEGVWREVNSTAQRALEQTT